MAAVDKSIIEPDFNLERSSYVHYTPPIHALPRILRADIEDILGARPKFSGRELDRQQVVLAAARPVMVNHGRACVRLSDLATALAMAPGTIRRYFPDLDYLLGEILRRHLLAISSAIGQTLCGVPADAHQRQAAARATYLPATRAVLGGRTEAHVPLVRERHNLPPDQRESVERMRAGLSAMLAGDDGEAALGCSICPSSRPPRSRPCFVCMPRRHVNRRACASLAVSTRRRAGPGRMRRACGRSKAPGQHPPNPARRATPSLNRPSRLPRGPCTPS